MADVPSVIILAGPTGAGKTQAALHLAKELGGAVINGDSRQVYADFPIVTAQPTEEEQDTCPHLLYSFLPTAEKMTAGRFRSLASESIAQVSSKGLVPLIVGGTGLYLRSLVEGLAPIPDVPPELQAEIIRRVEEQGPEVMHRKLSEVDPVYAGRIHQRDRQRIARALEVYEATGKPLSWWHDQPAARPLYRAFKIYLGMPLAELEPRLAKRIDLMLEQGALDEIATAWERCSDPQAPGWTGIGCAELLAHHLGRMDLEEAKQLWLRNTRAYAKRQGTWFNKEPDVHRFPACEESALAELTRQALLFLE